MLGTRPWNWTRIYRAVRAAHRKNGTWSKNQFITQICVYKWEKGSGRKEKTFTGRPAGLLSWKVLPCNKPGGSQRDISSFKEEGKWAETGKSQSRSVMPNDAMSRYPPAVGSFLSLDIDYPAPTQSQGEYCRVLGTKNLPIIVYHPNP